MKEENLIKTIKEDCERVADHFGIKELPEINIISASTGEAEFKLGACKFSAFPVALNVLKVKALDTINIFISSAKSFAQSILGKDGVLLKETELFMACIRYTAIHEMVHWIQMKMGIEVEVPNGDDPNIIIADVLETKCVNEAGNVINDLYRNEPLIKAMAELDIVNVKEKFKNCEKQEIKNLKDKIIAKIKDILS